VKLLQDATDAGLSACIRSDTRNRLPDHLDTRNQTAWLVPYENPHSNPHLVSQPIQLVRDDGTPRNAPLLPIGDATA